MSRGMRLTIMTVAMTYATMLAIAMGAEVAAGFFGVFTFIVLWESLSE